MKIKLATIKNKITRKKAFFIALALILVGCAVDVSPITSGQRADRANTDLQQIFSRQEPVIGKLSIYEAMARAIKYNLDHRVKLMEEFLAQGLVDLSSYEVLPSLAISNGYRVRSNSSGGTLKSISSGQQTLESSTSEERSKSLLDLSMSWNVIDFGITYVNALQRADRVFIAKELRRKAVQNIVRDVRSSFWRAVGAQRMKPELDAIISDIEIALDETAKGIGDDVDNLKKQKVLLSILKELLDLRKEASFAKLELASLMNLDPQQDFILDETTKPEYDEIDIDIKIPIRNMEQQAIMNRPELRIEDYEERISASEIRKELLRYLPGIEISTGIHNDSNALLQNKTWAETGIKVTWNLLNFLSHKKRLSNAENQKELAKLRRLAMNVAVLTQVHVAYKRLGQAKEEFQVAKALNDVNEKLYNRSVSDQERENTSYLELIKKASEMLVSGLKRDFAFADLQDAKGSLHLTLGIDPVPQVMTTAHVMSIANAIEARIKDFNSGYLYPENDIEAKRYPSRWLTDESQYAPIEEERFEEKYEVPKEVGRWAVGNWLDDVVNEIAEKRYYEFDEAVKPKEPPKPLASQQEKLSFFEKHRNAKKDKSFGFNFADKTKNTGRYQSIKTEDISNASQQQKPQELVNLLQEPDFSASKTPSRTNLLQNTASSNGLQLGAYSNLNTAKKEWQKMTARFNQLQKYEAFFEPVKISEKTTLYRLLIKDTTSNLNELCSNLKKQGHDCIIR